MKYIVLLYVLSAASVGATPLPSLLISFERFEQLSPARQRAYLHEVREAYYQFERTELADVEFAQSVHPAQRFWDALLPEAVAANRYCIIGGVRRPTVRSQGRWKCPTYGRPCAPHGDAGFLCGVVHENACVKRGTRGEDISKNCKEEGDRIALSQDKEVRLKRFEAKRNDIELIQRECAEKKFRNQQQCGAFTGQLTHLMRQYAPNAPRVDAGPPAAPTAGPSPIVAPAECKQLRGVVIEGTTKRDGVIEKSFHMATAKWAQAYAQLASQVSVTLPHAGRITGISHNNPAEVAELRNLLDVDPKKICDGDAPKRFVDFAMGTTQEVAPVSSATAAPLRVGHELVNAPNIKMDNFDPTNPAAFRKSELMKSVLETKHRCGSKSDQVVMLTIKDHGSNDCRLYMAKNKSLGPEDMRKNFIEPLAEQGVRVVINFDSCFSGCFVDALKNTSFKSPVCMTSTTRSETVGYGADDLVRGTYDDTYPTYLSRFKNPLKAHVCATLWDPLNAPVAAGAKSRSMDVGPKRSEALARVGKALGFNDLAAECGRAPTTYLGLDGVDEARMKALAQCPDVQRGFGIALRDQGGGAAFLNPVADPASAPGLPALEKMIETDANVRAVKANCDIDLSQYTPKMVAPAAARGLGEPEGKANR